MRGSHLQKPSRRNVIKMKDIRSKLPNLLEIPSGLVLRRKKLTLRVWFERTVTDSFDVKLLAAGSEKFPIHNDAAR